MIKVVNKKNHVKTDRDVYIGRPEMLGNPYPVSMGRDECIHEYKKYFYRMIDENSEFRTAVYDIISLATRGDDVNLVCWCAPEACHGDVIKEYCDNVLSGNFKGINEDSKCVYE